MAMEPSQEGADVVFTFGRALGSEPTFAAHREWLVTNGIGGYAAGTIAGTLTRSYHGLLIAALEPPLGRVLTLASLDAHVSYLGQTFDLTTHRRTGEPARACPWLERWRLEGTTPVWEYALADALLERRIWMAPGANTTYIRYTVRRASAPLALRLDALATARDHHAVAQVGDIPLQAEPIANGLRIWPLAGGRHLRLLSDQGTFTPLGGWLTDLFLATEAERGQAAVDNLRRVGRLTTTLAPGESLLVVATTEPAATLDSETAWQLRADYEAALVQRIDWTDDPFVFQLALAADQFIVERPLPGGTRGRTVIAGYPWFTDWGRDTMISLPGLTIPTRRPEVAAEVLRTFARFVDRGMVPNRFPDEGTAPEYNTADATLWLFEAVRAHHAAFAGDDLLAELFPLLEEIIDWHVRGTRDGIGLDRGDGLLRAGTPATQLTWMDVRVQGWVVTPRAGKPVEINALWYNALQSMAGFAQRLGRPSERYQTMAAAARAGFNRFWYANGQYLYDVIDTPNGVDATLRPNQIIAASLMHSPLDRERQQAVVRACGQALLTSVGLRSLDPAHPDYAPRYAGPLLQRDAAYHQGTVWAWLLGPYASAVYRLTGDRAATRRLLAPLLDHLSDGCIGTISEIFDGDPPHQPRGCFAQAWSVAEVLRVLYEMR
ncbi:glycogen debranching protein [Chloroflexus islandicus]|uniref:Glycogen debranching protein n=2 Tax=Chloroflexus islandicus TaxID=1707952 RepID=A0A178MBL2_9CHLR|nr:glycogen debranching protein [Chloroflexus islandicus]